MRVRAAAREALKGAMAIVVFFALGEAGLRVAYGVRNSMIAAVPLPYMVAHSYGPTPPWGEALRILEPDPVLMWRAQPNLRRTYLDLFTPARTEDERRAWFHRFWPALPASLHENPSWTVTLNSRGFRDVEFVRDKPPSTFRIVCLGDSWTFGANVGDDQTYPRRLKTLLTGQFPTAHVEVLNLGVLGYSSHQGLALMQTQVLDLSPDLVVLGFGMNDSSIAGFRDEDVATAASARTAITTLADGLGALESYRLLRYVALRLKDRPKSMGEYLSAAVERFKNGTGSAAGYAGAERWTRVSPTEFEANLRTMTELARQRGAGVILLFNELWHDNPYRAVLEKVSTEARVPLVDSSTLIATAKHRMQAQLERELGLRQPPATPAAGSTREVVFRVYSGRHPVRSAMSIVGPHQQLGNLAPNTVRMRDDGTGGDQRAGDRVWTYSTSFPVGTQVFYVYTNSGRDGKWEGLDVPDVRTFTVGGDTAVVYRPIESFGKLFLQADSWHTDAEGYDLIARAVVATLKRTERFARYVDRLASR